MQRLKTLLERAELGLRFLAMAARNRITGLDGQVFDIPATLDAIDCLAISNGGFERDETELVRRWLQPDTTIVEIGANIGFVSRYAFLEKLAPGGTYVCVEPNPLVHRALVRNMRRAAALAPGKRFEIVHAAIGPPARDGEESRFVMRRNLTSALVGQLPSKPAEKTAAVRTRSLGSLLREVAPGGATLICDAEGAEIPVVLDDPEAFAGIRQMAMELHVPAFTKRPETPDMMVDQLCRLGFRLAAQAGGNYYFSRS